MLGLLKNNFYTGHYNANQKKAGIENKSYLRLSF